MSNEELCRLCKASAGRSDLSKPKFKSTNKLLQTLFECYKIDIAILEESSCICRTCFGEVQRLGESLEKWSKAQEEIQEKPLEIDDSQVFQVKLEAPSSEDEEETVENNYMEVPEKEEEEVDDQSDQHEVKLEVQSAEDEEESSEEEGQNDDQELAEEDPLDPSDRDIFCVGLSHDGLAITKIFKDKTKATRMLCTCCDQDLEILAHIRMHSGIARSNPDYYCRECASEFVTLRELRTHVETMGHHKSKCGGRDLEFLCLRCNEIFPRFFDAMRHENSVHTLTELICVECNMYFKYRGSYEKHLRQHNATSDEPQVFACCYADCNRKFRVFSRYLKHVQWHNGRSHQCPHARCGTAIEPGNYLKHIRSHLRPPQRALQGQFMTLDPKHRVRPDARKVPYDRRQYHDARGSPDVFHPIFSDGGQFISLPKQLTLQNGKFLDVSK
ncbi:transcription factor grauzone-like [Drosophila gunungcola]|uniref:C2H2-type domain-containing protein n=1 Tax=Drosophila gunungcola TaxID=103775 RepID=A0A9Q0BM69_9MUSC|nr:transcription factor grauzone-like [Drosophila gunungcola]KAI8036725.1 hypothetical protein M5D96_010526 [Drosophila gunungcola]